MAEVLNGRRGAGPQPSDVARDAACRREEEVATAARRVDDRQVKERGDRVLRVLGDSAFDDGFERALEQHLHEAVGCVVAARELAGVARGLRAQCERTSVVGKC